MGRSPEGSADSALAQSVGAAHNDQAVNTQHLAFMSLHRDIYDYQGTEESQNMGWP
jgi:hypothetical protein